MLKVGVKLWVRDSRLNSGQGVVVVFCSCIYRDTFCNVNWYLRIVEIVQSGVAKLGVTSIGKCIHYPDI